jgi:hypothetical protein
MKFSLENKPQKKCGPSESKTPIVSALWSFYSHTHTHTLHTNAIFMFLYIYYYYHKNTRIPHQRDRKRIKTIYIYT